MSKKSNNNYVPEIFNDVLGPIMRGNSSSHVVGAYRMGKIIYSSVQGKLKSVDLTVDKEGSLAATYYGHGSHMGLVAGLSNVEITDEAIIDTDELLSKQDFKFSFHIKETTYSHPNHYHFVVTDKNDKFHSWDMISTGGGMIEVVSVDGFPVCCKGDTDDAFIFCDADSINELQKIFQSSSISSLEEKRLLHAIGTQKSVVASANIANGCEVLYIPTVLPIASTPLEDCEMPTVDDLQEAAKTSGRYLWEYALDYEKKRTGLSESQIFEKMLEIWHTMETSCEVGKKVEIPKNNILPHQSHLIEAGIKNKSLFPSDLINNLIGNITAVMESKAAIQVIVAAPTAGSCGCLPGTILAVKDQFSIPQDSIIKALLSAGIVGVVIAKRATFAAEVAACQVECGAASAMTAAAIAEIFGGNMKQSIDAASIALQAVTGLACDPVAERVEVPCLWKNVMCGMNAISSASMALAGFDAVVPLHETIDAVYKIGLLMPACLRCTYGGLGETPTSNRIKKELDDMGCYQ